jgi:hypothetical protein
MNEELESQLSAMFDDELSAAECELLARRLSRDEQLKARWGRYAVIGASIRAERGVRLHAALARKVNAAILAEPALGAAAAPQRALRSGLRWRQAVAGVAVAAGVAAVSVFWLRAEAPLARAPLSAQLAPQSAGSSVPAQADSYVLPRAPASPPVVVPVTELANYVVAHSMVSSPVARRNLLSAFMTSDPGAAGTEEPLEAVKSDAQ